LKAELEMNDGRIIDMAQGPGATHPPPANSLAVLPLRPRYWCRGPVCPSEKEAGK
jgi:hypothetical protein